VKEGRRDSFSALSFPSCSKVPWRVPEKGVLGIHPFTTTEENGRESPVWIPLRTASFTVKRRWMEKGVGEKRDFSSGWVMVSHRERGRKRTFSPSTPTDPMEMGRTAPHALPSVWDMD